MKVSELLSESPAFEKDLDENKPVVAKGVKGVKSTPFTKRFKNFAAYEKWLETEEAGNYEVNQVMNEGWKSALAATAIAGGVAVGIAASPKLTVDGQTYDKAIVNAPSTAKIVTVDGKKYKIWSQRPIKMHPGNSQTRLYQKIDESVQSLFQVRIQSDDWQDISLGNDITLEDIADAVEAPPTQTTKFDISKLTEIVERWIGDGPDGYGPNGGAWDEMHFDVASLKHDVLKVSYVFSGFDKHRDERRKTGIITIMPA